jgi:peptidoglycan-N-acetylglucosamine deacetylase
LRGLSDIKAVAGAGLHRMDRFAPRVASANRSLPGGAPSVALTFDDGPDDRFTPAVLDVLAERQVRATFFLVGNRAERHVDIVRRIAAEGHALGSHTASHPDMWELNRSAAIAEFRRGREILESITGNPAPLFRPPKGWMDLSLAIALRRFRFNTWLWNVDPEDWSPGATSKEILRGLGDLQAGDIVLLHDAIERPIDSFTTNRSATIEALPGIIDHAQVRGLQLVPLS